jgi:hypothetical protein
MIRGIAVGLITSLDMGVGALWPSRNTQNPVFPRSAPPVCITISKPMESIPT